MPEKKKHLHGKPYYRKMLQLLGSLSSIFSESAIPYLNYRVTENLFCKAFDAKNLSRSDVSVDAVLNNVGIGIKTFIERQGKNFEKIAEFNKDSSLFKDLALSEKIRKISELRNERLEATQRICGLKKMIYHCIARRKSKILVFECGMDSIDIPKIRSIESKGNIIKFEDRKNKYAFNTSKSTLYRQFITKEPLLEIQIKIIADPFEVLEKKFEDLTGVYFKELVEHSFVILPLYSRTKIRKLVHPKSGLNQWNAGGRKRDISEVYIPIPIWIHKRFPGFFPPRDKPFDLILPDGRILNTKVCQDDSKALMSNPNLALGKWLLRDVLNLKEREVLTYEKLQQIGLDSVIIEKLNKGKFSINFRKADTYEEFIKRNL